MSATDDLHAAALMYAAEQGWTKPVPPPPPVTAQFDGRASAFVGTFPTVTGVAPAPITQTPPGPQGGPYGLWDGYAYQDTDISIVPDARWGKAYLCQPAAGHHNPYDQTAVKGATACQISKRRPVSIGSVFYWSESVMPVSIGWQWPDWGSIVSLGYETVLEDQLALGFYQNEWSVHSTAGLVTNGKAAIDYSQALKPVQFDAYTDWIIGAKIAADNTGWIELHMRPSGGTWSVVYSKTGVPTTVWKSSPATIPGSVLDKEGVYCGWWNTAQTPAPTFTLRLRGLMRDATLADALTRFP